LISVLVHGPFRVEVADFAAAAVEFVSVDNDPPPANASSGNVAADGNVAVAVATDGSDDSERVTDLMIAAGLSQLRRVGIGRWRRPKKR